MTSLTKVERDCLQALHEADPDGEHWTYVFHACFTRASNEHGPDAVIAALPVLRRKKLVDGEGRGKLAGYSINDKGRAALKEGAVA